MSYKCEFLAVELDMRLNGVLRQRELPDFNTEREDTMDKKRELTIYYLRERICESNHAFPSDLGKLADWIEAMFRREKAGLCKGITITDGRYPHANKILLAVNPGMITFMGWDQANRDPRTTNDSFSFVRSPIYPKKFGRHHSTHVEVVFTRQYYPDVFCLFLFLVGLLAFHHQSALFLRIELYVRGSRI